MPESRPYIRAAIAGGAFVTALVVLVIVARYPALEQDVESAAAAAPASTASASSAEVRAGFLYGRIITVDDSSYEGRLRWGGDQEAFWGDYFNGAKKGNPWAVHDPLQPKERSGLEVFGFKLGGEDRSINFRRLFLARFG